MKDETTEVVDQLRSMRSVRLLRLLDDAGLARRVEVEPAAAAVVAPYRWLLERIGDRIRLTQAGYLPPAIVTEAMTALGWHDDWFGKGNREDMTHPVLELRESAQRFGLVRKQRGELLITKLGRALRDDPVALWWHLAERLPDARSEADRHAGVLYLLSVSAQRPRDDVLLAEGMTALGWTEGESRRQVSAQAVAVAAAGTREMFDRLGLLPRRGHRDEPEPAPAASATRLAHAALLGRSGPEPAPAPARGPRAVELTVTVADIAPPVWRRLVVPADLSLRELHNVLQTALGWENYHLHVFDVAGVRYGDVDETGSRIGDEETLTVGEAAAFARDFGYEYDFGDGWAHRIRIERMVDDATAGPAYVLDGARACPPEDSGGPGGYARLLEVLDDPSHGDHDDLQVWLRGAFDPEAFDLETINEHLALFDRQDRQRLALR